METIQCPYRRLVYECKITNFTLRNATFCGRCLQGQHIDSLELNTSALMERSMDKMEEKIKPAEKWNENVETCSDCGIQWKKIGKSCPVCYSPPEKHEAKKHKNGG